MTGARHQGPLFVVYNKYGWPLGTERTLPTGSSPETVIDLSSPLLQERVKKGIFPLTLVKDSSPRSNLIRTFTGS